MKNLGLLFCLFLSYNLSAQKKGLMHKFEPISGFSGSVGLSQYIGELNDYSSFKHVLLTRARVGASFERRFSRWYKISLDFDFSHIAGDDYYSEDLDSYVRNLRFRNNLTSIGFKFFMNPVGFGDNFHSQKNMFGSLFFGLNATHSEPKSVSPVEGEIIKLRPLLTEGQGLNDFFPETYARVLWSVPVGLELEKKISNNVYVGFVFSYNFFFSDYLDDVGEGVYPNRLLLPTELGKAMSNRSNELLLINGNDKRKKRFEELLLINGSFESPSSYLSNLSQDGTQRGNPSNNDSIYSISFKISIVIPDRLKCPKF